MDIAFTEKNGLRKIYINGKLDYSIQREPSIRYYNRITSIGGQSLSNYRYFNGKIDELSLWDRAVEESEIISLNNNIIPTNTTGLKGYYSFDNKDLYLKDKSSSNNNGTVVNTTNLNNSTSFDIKAMYFEFSSNSINSVPLYFGENKYIELTDKLVIKNNDYTETTNSNISLNSINKVVMRWNGSKYEIFINGVKDNSISVSTPTLLNINEVTLGNDLYNGKYFNGDIYDVRVSSSEISEYDALASTDTLNIKYTLDYNNTEVIYKPIDYDTYLFDSVKKEEHNYTYDLDWKDQLKEYDGFLYTYDEIGNPLTITKDSVLYRSFVWKKGRVLSSQYIRRSQDGLNDIDVFYKYNDSGIRVEKKVVDKVTLNEEVTTYKLSGSSIVEEIKGTDIIHYTYDLEGSLIAMTYNNEIYYYIKNITGDIIGLLDEEGNKVVSYEYDSWGKILSINDTSNIDLGNKNPFRYKGYYYDNESEYYYLNSRYYDSEVKRFINADGYVSTGSGIIGHNMYSYANNNPIMLADPNGTWIQIAVKVLIVGVSLYFAYQDYKEFKKNPTAFNLAVLASNLLPSKKVKQSADITDIVVKQVAKNIVKESADEIIQTGWKLGDDITTLTKNGNLPSWNTVRQRYWKNEAYLYPGKYKMEDIIRMQKGKAPLVEFEDTGKFYSMELHHLEGRSIANPHNYKNLEALSPWDHSLKDPYRYWKPPY